MEIKEILHGVLIFVFVVFVAYCGFSLFSHSNIDSGAGKTVKSELDRGKELTDSIGTGLSNVARGIDNAGQEVSESERIVVSISERNLSAIGKAKRIRELIEDSQSILRHVQQGNDGQDKKI